MIYYLVVSIALLTTTRAEKFFQIDDIPIEHFEHEDIQNGAIDVELMPRSARSFQISSKYQPREQTDQYEEGLFENIPESEGFFDRHFGDVKYHQRLRSKREVSEKASLIAKDPLKLVSELGKPLELSVIEPEKIQEVVDENITKIPDGDETNPLINDFIRFRRSAKQNGNTGSESLSSTSFQGINRSTNEEKSSHLQNPLRNFSHVDKLVGNPQAQKDSSRETRGISKEQWVRHAYPVRGDELTYDDNMQEPSENVPIPRVHFVTEGMSGVLTGEQKYDREARARSLNKEISRNLARDSTPEMDFIQPRYTRHYDSWPSRGDRYYQDQRDLRDPYPYRKPYDPYERSDNRYSFSPNRQKRIIYYATLPELPRTSPRADYRGRYDGYRDRFDDYDDRDRYYEPYRFRKEYYKKPSFEDARVKKPDYPVKVSADLNIRDVKKNPDRIYSDVPRARYGADEMY